MKPQTLKIEVTYASGRTEALPHSKEAMAQLGVLKKFGTVQSFRVRREAQ